MQSGDAGAVGGGGGGGAFVEEADLRMGVVSGGG
jgi:hypothetical protein